jgi:hypothetical protein
MNPSPGPFGTSTWISRAAQVFRLKAEGSKLSHKARIEPLRTVSEFCMITHDEPLKAFSLQSICLVVTWISPHLW